MMNYFEEQLEEAFKPMAKMWNGNKMSIKTDKGYYVSGELVTGTITVLLTCDVACKGVMFKVRPVYYKDGSSIFLRSLALSAPNGMKSKLTGSSVRMVWMKREIPGMRASLWTR
jgi:hypothetical protein